MSSLSQFQLCIPCASPVLARIISSSTFALGCFLISCCAYRDSSCKSLSESQYQHHNLKMPTLKHRNACFVAYLHSTGTQQGKLHQSSVTMSRVTILLCGSTQELILATANRKNSGEVWGKNGSEWTQRVEISSGKKSPAVS